MVKCNEDFAEVPHEKPPTSTSTTTLFPPNFCRFPGHSSTILNPGNILNLHKKTLDLMPEWIEGLSLRCAKNVDVNKTISVDWMMGNNTPVGFRIGGSLCRKDCENITVSKFRATNCHFKASISNIPLIFADIAVHRIRHESQHFSIKSPCLLSSVSAVEIRDAHTSEESVWYRKISWPRWAAREKLYNYVCIAQSQTWFWPNDNWLFAKHEKEFVCRWRAAVDVERSKAHGGFDGFSRKVKIEKSEST